VIVSQRDPDRGVIHVARREWTWAERSEQAPLDQVRHEQQEESSS
jgi:hypothetical protein